MRKKFLHSASLGLRPSPYMSILGGFLCFFPLNLLSFFGGFYSFFPLKCFRYLKILFMMAQIIMIKLYFYGLVNLVWSIGVSECRLVILTYTDAKNDTFKVGSVILLIMIYIIFSLGRCRWCRLKWIFQSF